MRPRQGDIDLRLRGRSVSRLFIDHRLGLEFLEQGVETTLVIGGRPRLEHGGARLELSAEQLAEVGKASILVRKTVDRAVAHEDGSLEVNFMDGDMLFVGPAYQGQSLGRKLLAFTRTQMPDEIELRCVRENEKAWRWYEREGFVFEREEVSTVTGFMMKCYRWTRQPPAG